jgi:hypothetical protein
MLWSSSSTVNQKGKRDAASLDLYAVDERAAIETHEKALWVWTVSTYEEYCSIKKRSGHSVL